MKKFAVLGSRIVLAVSASTVLFAGFSQAAIAEWGPATGQEAGQRQRVIPVYALHKDGTPAAGLTARDLVISVNGQGVEDFTLANRGASRKTIFLVFDSASVSYTLLAQSKKIAETVISRSQGQSRFIVLAIEPYFGLQTILGPTRNRREVVDAVSRLLSSKKTDYMRSRAADGTGIRDVSPRGQDLSKLASEEVAGREDSDRRKDGQLSTTIITSLRTLNAILGLFPDSIKIVHLYSSGIPTSGTQDHTRLRYESETLNFATPDSLTYDRLKTIGQSFKKTGALLFLINPAGTRVGEDNPDSGEHSLHVIVEASRGRYFEGTDTDIAQALEATERGYYEISLPLPQEFAGPEIALDIRPKDSTIDLFSAASLARTRRLPEMTPQEREALVLSLLTGGLVGDIDLKIRLLPVEAKQVGESAVLVAQLPFDLSQKEWDIYKVWRDPAKGLVQFEKEHVRSDSTRLEFAMDIKMGFLQDAVLVQTKTGTVFICQAKGGAKK